MNAGPASDPAELLARTTLHVRRGPFSLAAWQTNQLSAVLAGLLRARLQHTFVITDELEVTAFVPADALTAFPAPLRAEHGWCLVTLDTVMDWDVVGVLAAVTGTLAAAGVPLGAVTAFSRDHLLLTADHLDDALKALAELCAGIHMVD